MNPVCVIHLSSVCSRNCEFHHNAPVIIQILSTSSWIKIQEKEKISYDRLCTYFHASCLVDSVHNAPTRCFHNLLVVLMLLWSKVYNFEWYHPLPGETLKLSQTLLMFLNHSSLLFHSISFSYSLKLSQTLFSHICVILNSITPKLGVPYHIEPTSKRRYGTLFQSLLWNISCWPCLSIWMMYCQNIRFDLLLKY